MALGRQRALRVLAKELGRRCVEVLVRTYFPLMALSRVAKLRGYN
jgi:hypothetical protein